MPVGSLPDTFGSTDATLVTSVPRRAEPVTVVRGTSVGRYVIVAAIGRGAMGTVYAAYDPELDRKVAVKLLHDSGGENLLREAQTLARLMHPNVVTVHDAGRFEGHVFIAMEHVAGTNLRQWLAASPRTLDEIVRVFVAAGRGLAAAHAAGIVHRDFKPDNVLIGESRDGRSIATAVRVADFGIAALREAESDPPDRGNDTASRRAIGTPAYMAPEQRLGFAVDAHADQYAFCIAMFEAITGVRPTADVDLSASGGVPALPEVNPRRAPARLRRVLRTGLAIAPNDRHRDMDELLERILAATRGRARGVAAAVVVALAAVGVIWALRPTASGPCALVDDLAAATWSASQRTTVQAAFREGGARYADATLATTTAALDTWMVQWKAEWSRACEDVHVRGEQTLAQLSVRESCLDSGRAQAIAVVELLQTATPDVIEHALDAVAVLPDPTVCRDVDALRRGVAPPDTQAIAERVRAIESDLARAAALSTAERGDEATAVAEQALADAEETGYLPVRAQARVSLGHIIGATRHSQKSADLYLDAMGLAIACRDELVFADAAVAFLTTRVRIGTTAECEQWSVIADAAVLRAGDPPELRSALLFEQSVLASDRGEARKAVEFAERALEIVRVADLTGAREARAHVVLGMASRVAGSFDRALEHATIAHEIYARINGETHPRTRFALQLMAVSYNDIGRIDDSIAVSERLLADLAGDPAALARATGVRSNLAVFLAAAGRYDEARELLRQVETEYIAQTGEDSRDVGETLGNRASVELWADDTEAAQIFAERAHEVLERDGPDHPSTAMASTILGDVAMRQDRWADANRQYERALAGLEPLWGREHVSLQEVTARRAHAKARLGDTATALAEMERLSATLDVLPLPVRAVVLLHGLQIMEIADNGRAPELRARLMATLDELGKGGAVPRRDLERWDRQRRR